MAMYAVNYDGLRKRDTYNEIIDYLQFGQEKVTYPDRFAKRVRETPQLTNLLDGEGLGKGDMEEQQLNHMKELMKEFAIREAGGTAQFSRVNASTNTDNGGDGSGSGSGSSTDPPKTERASGSGEAPHYDDDLQDQAERVSEVSYGLFQKYKEKKDKNADTARQNLNGAHQQQWQGYGLGIDDPDRPNPFLERMKVRRESNPKINTPFKQRQQINRDRELDRQNKIRDQDFKATRVTQKFNIATPPGSPGLKPLIPVYEERTTEAVKKRRPKVRKDLAAALKQQRMSEKNKAVFKKRITHFNTYIKPRGAALPADKLKQRHTPYSKYPLDSDIP